MPLWLVRPPDIHVGGPVLDTQLVFETWLLLEEIQYIMLNIMNGGMPMRKCTWLFLVLSPLTVTASGVDMALWLVHEDCR